MPRPTGRVQTRRADTFLLPPPLGEVPQCAHWGGEGASAEGHPLSLAALDSSPRGGAKAFLQACQVGCRGGPMCPPARFSPQVRTMAARVGRGELRNAFTIPLYTALRRPVAASWTEGSAVRADEQAAITHPELAPFSFLRREKRNGLGPAPEARPFGPAGLKKPGPKRAA